LLDDITVTLGQNPPMPSNTPLTEAELDRLDACLPNALTPSMLDGYLAAVASGPNFVMPDRVLFWVSETAAAEALPSAKIALPGKSDNDLIIRRYQDINDTLNNKAYVPRLTEPSAWCSGFIAGVRTDFAAWEPLIVEQGGLLMQVMIYSIQVRDQEIETAETFLLDVTRQIHAYWLERRQQGQDMDGLLDQLASAAPAAGAGELALGAQATQLLH
jgi:yecA family protein